MTKKEYLDGAERCELCGSPKKVELHHIVPLVAGGEDVLDNWICICKSCHSKLTPNSLLTKLGLKKLNTRNCVVDFRNGFYERLYKEMDSGAGWLDGVEILDIFDDEYEKFEKQIFDLIGKKRNAK